MPAGPRSSAGTATCSAGPWNPRDSPFTNPSGGTSTTKTGASTPSATFLLKSLKSEKTSLGGSMPAHHRSFLGTRSPEWPLQARGSICFFPWPRKTRFALMALLALVFNTCGAAQQNSRLETAIQKVMDRPEYKHASFGIEFFDLASHTIVYAHDADKLFVPASTTKTLTEGALLANLGKDFRFHTRIFRSGPVDGKGRLKGNLVLVASGDPNLSNRIQPDNTLAFVDEDHSYGGPAVSGDPLTVIKELARQVRASGIRRVDGLVLVDTSLFPDGPREGGTDGVMSSIIINDN